MAYIGEGQYWDWEFTGRIYITAALGTKIQVRDPSFSHENL